MIIEGKKSYFVEGDLTGIALYEFHAHFKCNSIPVQRGFFPRRTIDKEMGEGSFHWLSQHLESDFMGSSNVNVCQLLVLF